MEVLMTREFAKWAKKQGMTSALLKAAAVELAEGSVEANLGSHLYKKRIQASGRGKRGGARVVMFYLKNKRAIFVHGFLKNEKINLSDSEALLFKKFANILLSMSDNEYILSKENGDFVEVN